MKYNICLINDYKLRILLEELLNQEIFFTEIDETSYLDEKYFLKNSIDIVLLDMNIENLEEILLILKKLNLIVILVGYKKSAKDIISLLKTQLIDDYLEKDEYFKIETLILENLKKYNRLNYRVILKSDNGTDVYIDINKIVYISYDRQSKKSQITVDSNIISVKKTLSEIEAILKNNENFLRIERGVIVNKLNIISINLKEEFIEFLNNEKIFLGRRTLKQLKENIESKNRHLVI